MAVCEPVQSSKKSKLEISLGDNGVHSELCAVAYVAFTVQCGGTCRLLPFLMTMAPAWLFLLQIHVWLSKLIHWRPAALDSLAWPLALHQRRRVSHLLEAHLGDLGLGDYQWCPLRIVPRKPTAPEGYWDLVPLLPTLSPSCANEDNWSVFSSALRGASWYIHSALTWWTLLLQLKAGGVQMILSTQKNREPHGKLFLLPTSGTAVCLLASKWPFTFAFGQIDLTTLIYPAFLKVKMIYSFWAVKTDEISQELMKSKCHSILL